MERETWRSIFESETAGQFLFHYTPLSTAVEAILPTRQIRFSRFSNMRDPRESEWAFGSAYFGDVDGEDRLYWETLSGFEEAKATVRILSLTADRGGDAGKPLFGRGFAHPRLWEQYAANHCGVCLCFQKEALTQAVDDAMERIDDAPPASQFDLQAVQQQGILEFVRAHFEEHLHELFLTKLTDWESEVEYRYLTFWEAPDELFVDISEA